MAATSATSSCTNRALSFLEKSAILVIKTMAFSLFVMGEKILRGVSYVRDPIQAARVTSFSNAVVVALGCVGVVEKM